MPAQIVRADATAELTVGVAYLGEWVDGGDRDLELAIGDQSGEGRELHGEGRELHGERTDSTRGTGDRNCVTGLRRFLLARSGR